MKRFFAVSLLISMLLLSAMTLVPASVRAHVKVDFNDRFAGQTTGAHGSIKFDDTQEGTLIEISKIKARSLTPNHEYDIWVTVSPPGPPATHVISSHKFGSFITNDDGKLKVKKLQVTVPGPGTWRLDVFVTHTHPTVTGVGAFGPAITALLNRDPLLSCEPAVVVTST